jgi:uncharacterized protein YdeI (YjbR/CyaY-like superfamily)
MEITKTFYPRNRQELRKWLEKNHQKKKEIWLIYYKKHTGKPRVDYKDMVKECLCFGWIDGTVKSIDDKKYAQRITPRRKGSQWSETNTKIYKELKKQGLVSEHGKKVFEDGLKK